MAQDSWLGCVLALFRNVVPFHFTVVSTNADLFPQYLAHRIPS